MSLSASVVGTHFFGSRRESHWFCLIEWTQNGEKYRGLSTYHIVKLLKTTDDYKDISYKDLQKIVSKKTPKLGVTIHPLNLNSNGHPYPAITKAGCRSVRLVPLVPLINLLCVHTTGSQSIACSSLAKKLNSLLE